MVSGVSDLPYTRQYAGTARWWYFVKDMGQWGFCWPLGLAAIAGTIVAVVRALLRPTRAELLLLVWVVPYFAITGGFHTKFLRYILPVTPMFALFAALALVLLYDWARRHQEARSERQQARDEERETITAEPSVAETRVTESDFEDELGLLGDTSVASAVTVQSRGDELVVILSP